jgi:hypothetical protein
VDQRRLDVLLRQRNVERIQERNKEKKRAGTIASNEMADVWDRIRHILAKMPVDAAERTRWQVKAALTAIERELASWRGRYGDMPADAIQQAIGFGSQDEAEIVVQMVMPEEGQGSPGDGGLPRERERSQSAVYADDRDSETESAD